MFRERTPILLELSIRFSVFDPCGVAESPKAFIIFNHLLNFCRIIG
jgi:hypothetical protein